MSESGSESSVKGGFEVTAIAGVYFLVFADGMVPTDEVLSLKRHGDEYAVQVKGAVSISDLGTTHRFRALDAASPGDRAAAKPPETPVKIASYLRVPDLEAKRRYDAAPYLHVVAWKRSVAPDILVWEEAEFATPEAARRAAKSAEGVGGVVPDSIQTFERKPASVHDGGRLEVISAHEAARHLGVDRISPLVIF